jgi:4-hydroxy-2-oxoheptanedioate aldolase
MLERDYYVYKKEGIFVFNQKEVTRLGTWVQINNPEVVEIMGNGSFDFVILDMEHGNIWYESLVDLIRAAKLRDLYSIVRVPELNGPSIMKVLDLGANGIIVPQVSTKEQAQKAVSFAKYPPDGQRGSCPCIRAANHYVEDWGRFAKKCNHDVSVIILVEGPEGIKNFGEIVQTEGVDAFMIGPFDLSVALGIPGEVTHPLVEQKLDEVFALAKAYNKEIIGVDFSNNPIDAEANLKKWKARGSRIFMTGIDKWIFTGAVKQFSQFKTNL